ncbi:MAG: biotin/lipoyl-containing protein, partial [Frankia sp.]
TEMVTGIDLVAEQLRIADGEPLGYRQGDVTLTGHAIEARVYAEDPARGFLPSAGTVLALREPAGPGVRVDSGIAVGQPVGTDYDPMLAKVIAHGPDRSTALARLDAALADTVVLGLRTNLAFVRALLAHPDVAAGRLDTGLVERDLAELVTDDLPADAPAVFGLAALAETWPSGGGGPVDLWDIPTGWRGTRSPAPLLWRVGTSARHQAATEVAVTGSPDRAQVAVDGAEPRAGTVRTTASGDLLVTLDGRTRRWSYVREGRARWLGRDGASWLLIEADPAASTSAEAEAVAEVRSPMPGTVIALHALAGAHVTAGDPVVVVEAMKMEHTLTAPRTGDLKDVLVQVGDQVALDQVLAVVAEGAAQSPKTAESPKTKEAPDA